MAANSEHNEDLSPLEELILEEAIKSNRETIQRYINKGLIEILMKAKKTLATHSHMPSEWRNELTTLIDLFANDADYFRSSTISRTKWPAYAAVKDAFFIGVALGQTADAPAILEMAKRDRTRNASAARRKETVQKIIDDEAEAYWKRSPDRLNKLSDTARAILPKVKAKAKKAGAAAGDWPSGDDEKIRERIRGRLRRRKVRTIVDRPKFERGIVDRREKSDITCDRV